MSDELTTSHLRQLRLRSQRLVGDPTSDPVQAIRDVFALQAQDAPAGLLAVRARTRDVTAADVERARTEDHALIRTWAMRGTLHLMATEDYAWLLPYLVPRFRKQYTARHKELGLTEAIIGRALPAIREALADRPLTRADLADRLRPQGIPVEGQAIAHLIGIAAYSGILAYGADIGKKQGHALLSDWTRIDWDAPTDDVPARLAERYLRAYAPATSEDFAGWAGIPITEARNAFHKISHQLVEVNSDGVALYLLKERATWLNHLTDDLRIVKLLPAFDATLLGYKSRDWYLPAKYAKRIFRGGGMLVTSVLVDGKLIGTWRTRKNKRGMIIIVEPFESLPDHAIPMLEQEAADVGRFLSINTDLEVS